jgi:glutathione S-transferase
MIFSQEELEVPYEIKHWKRTPDGLAPKELASIHPIGLAPIITEGNNIYAESGAIVGKFGLQPRFVF